MKKNIFAALVIQTLVLFVTGCKQDSDPVPHTDPSFLVGTWTNPPTTFTINADYTFTCNVMAPNPQDGTQFPLQVTGRLDFTSGDLGPNDYIMRNMSTPANGVPTQIYVMNEYMRDTIESFSNKAATLRPTNAAMSQFEFNSTDPLAGPFFNGTYTKQQQ